MGWRSKLLLMLIVYFAGFATAIYYLAPSNETASRGADALNKFASCASKKVTAGCAAISKYDFKGAYNKGMQSIKDMKTRNVAKSQETQEE